MAYNLMHENYLKKLKKRYQFCKTFFDYFKFNFYDLNLYNSFLKNNYFFDKFFDSISNFTNSNYINFNIDDDEFQATKISLKQWYWIFVNYKYLWELVPYFLFYSYDDEKKWNLCYNWQIIFYWTFCRLYEIWENSNFNFLLKKCFSANMKLSRVDVKNDLFSNNDKFISLPRASSLINIRNGVNYQNYYVWTRLNSWNYWNKKIWRKFIRMYNKFVDIARVKNFSLYSNTFWFKVYHRLEFQLNYKEVWHIKDYNWLLELLSFYETWHIPPSLNKVEYVRSNPCVFQLEKRFINLFKQIKRACLPLVEILIFSLTDSWFSKSDIDKIATWILFFKW